MALRPLDLDAEAGLSEMDLAWVQHTDNPLFRELSVYSRYLLYLYWKESLTFKEMEEVLRRDKYGATTPT